MPAIADAPPLDAVQRKRAERSFAYYLTHMRTDEGPVPDWPYLRGIADALDTDRDVIILKRRQVLISWLLGGYLDWSARLHDGWFAGAVSIGQDFADELGRKIRQCSRYGPEWAAAPGSGVKPIRYANGNEVHCFPSTETAGVGFTLADYLMDECSKHRYARENKEGAYPALYKPPAGATRRRGRLIEASTTHPRQGPSGFMYEEWQNAVRQAEVFWPERESFAEWAERNSKGGQLPNTIPIFLSRWCRPDQGAEWWEAERERMLVEGIDGEMVDAHAIDAYYPETPEDAFGVAEGLVYGKDKDGIPIYDPVRNIRPAPCTWAECKWRLVAIDPGGTGDPTGFMAVGVTHDERVHVYAASRIPGMVAVVDMDPMQRDVTYHSWLTDIHKQGPIHAVVVGETGGGSITETLRRLGWRAFKFNPDRAKGYNLVRSMLKSGRMTVAPSLRKITEGEVYVIRWKERREGSTQADLWLTVVDSASHHGELWDACARYAVVGIIDKLPGEPLPLGVAHRGGSRVHRGGARVRRAG